MTDGLPALLMSGCLLAAVAACGVADPEAGATLPEAAHDITYTGELSYRQRIAVHPRTVAMVELRGALLLDGRPTCLSEDVPVSIEAGEHALGTVWLQQLPAASGARYVSVQDPQTGFWSRGERGLLEVRGQQYPECGAVQDPAPPEPLGHLRATGNEPGWLLELAGGELRLVLDYGETRITAPAPEPLHENALTRYRLDLDDTSIEMTLRQGPCTDTMTGMPHPYDAVLRIDERELHGCAGDPASLLLGEAWRVAQIAGDELPASSRVTMQFDDEGRAGGRAGGRGPCNSWGGAWTLSGEGLGIKEIVATMMACEPAVMARERALFDTLAAVYRFEIDADGTLILHAGDQRTIRALR